jgi:dTDP-4-dehydrorhamnose 3,5-epimerase
MKQSDEGFAGFGEAYFSTIREGHVKGWKRHHRMTLNFVVPSGQVRVCVRDEPSGTHDYFLLGPNAPSGYARLTIVPGLWVAFGGVAQGDSLLLNIASIEHDPTESDTLPFEAFPWTW